MTFTRIQIMLEVRSLFLDCLIQYLFLAKFEIGTSREKLIIGFGPLYVNEETESKKVEVFIFLHGYRKATKTGRVIFRTAVDVFTLEFLETIGTPAELHFDGDEMAFHVAYDEHDRIDGVKGLRKKYQ